MPWELPLASHLRRLHRLGVQEEVGIGGVESECQFASVVAEASLPAEGASAGFALPRNEISLAACRIDHLRGSGELEEPGAALRRNRLGSLGCTGETVGHTQPLASCRNKDVV